jgi:hypothetical protein
MNARRPIYERLATLQVSTDALRPGQVADRIVDALGAPTAAGHADTSAEKDA